MERKGRAEELMKNLNDVPDEMLLQKIMELADNPEEELKLLDRYRQKIGEEADLRKMEVLYTSGDEEKAVNIAKKIPKNPLALYFLGRICLDRGEQEQALDYYRQAYEQEGDAKIASEYAELLLSNGEITTAERILHKMSEENPKRFENLAWISYLQRRLDISENYLEMFRELSSSKEEYSRYSILKALITLTQGRIEGVTKILTESSNLRIVDTDPLSNTLYYLILAKLYKAGEIENYELNEQLCLDRALRIARRSKRKDCLVLCLVERNELKEAMKVIKDQDSVFFKGLG